MSIRITLKNISVFKELSKRVMGNCNEIPFISTLKLNQFREFFSIYLGYDSNHDLEESIKSNKKKENENITITSLSSLDYEDTEFLTDRILNLNIQYPKFLVDLKDEINIENMKKFEKIFLEEVSINQKPTNQFISFLITCPLETELAKNIQPNKFIQKIKETTGINIIYNEELSYIKPLSEGTMSEHDYHDEDRYEFSHINKKLTDTFHSNNVSHLIPGIKFARIIFSVKVTPSIKESTLSLLWDESSNIDNIEDYLLLNKGSEDNWFSISEVETHSEYASDYGESYASDEHPSLINIINNIPNGIGKGLTLKLYSENIHSGFLVVNKNKANIFTTGYDKINSANQEFERDDIMVFSYPKIRDFIEKDSNIKTSLYEFSDLGVQAKLDCEINRDLLLKTLTKKPKRIASFFDGAVLSMPRKSGYLEDYAKEDGWEFENELINYSDSHFLRENPTSALLGMPEDTTYLESIKEDIEGFEPETMLLTKIIAHYDGSVGHIIATIFDNEGCEISSESYSLTKANDDAGFQDCKMTKRLKSLAHELNIEVLESEQEYEWYSTTLSGMNIYESTNIDVAIKSNQNIVQLRIYQKSKRLLADKEKINKIAGCVKDILLKYTPHNSETKKPVIDFSIKPDNSMIYLNMFFQTGQTDEIIERSIKYMEEYGCSDSLDEDTNGLSHFPVTGPSLLNFTIEGTRTQLDEVKIGLGQIEMAHMFNGSNKERIPGMIDEMNFQNFYHSLVKAIGLDGDDFILQLFIS